MEDSGNIEGIGCVLFGQVECGELVSNTNVIICPPQLQTNVLSIELFHNRIQKAGLGDRVAFNASDINAKQVKPGFVVCNIENPL